MKWFTKWFNKKVKQAYEEAQSSPEEDSGYTDKLNYVLSKGSINGRNVPATRSDALHSNGTNLTMYNANGGMVVELRSYDFNTDRHNNVLYVIPKDQDMGQQLAHIITLEALKR